jgi:hypothetical protein
MKKERKKEKGGLGALGPYCCLSPWVGSVFADWIVLRVLKTPFPRNWREQPEAQRFNLFFAYFLFLFVFFVFFVFVSFSYYFHKTQPRGPWVILVFHPFKHNQHHTTVATRLLFVADSFSWLPDSPSLHFPISQSQLKYFRDPISESRVLLFHYQPFVLWFLLLRPFQSLEEDRQLSMLSRSSSSNPQIQNRPMIPKLIHLRLLSSFSSLAAPAELVSTLCSFPLLEMIWHGWIYASLSICLCVCLHICECLCCKNLSICNCCASLCSFWNFCWKFVLQYNAFIDHVII